MFVLLVILLFDCLLFVVCLRCLLLFWLWFVVGRFRLLLFLVVACGLACGTQSKLVDTWRITPFSKWLITMVIVSPLSRVIPLPNGLRGPMLLTGTVLQVPPQAAPQAGSQQGGR